jgi:hypothetical protein
MPWRRFARRRCATPGSGADAVARCGCGGCGCGSAWANRACTVKAMQRENAAILKRCVGTEIMVRKSLRVSYVCAGCKYSPHPCLPRLHVHASAPVLERAAGAGRTRAFHFGWLGGNVGLAARGRCSQHNPETRGPRRRTGGGEACGIGEISPCVGRRCRSRWLWLACSSKGRSRSWRRWRREVRRVFRF